MQVNFMREFTHVLGLMRELRPHVQAYYDDWFREGVNRTTSITAVAE